MQNNATHNKILVIVKYFMVAFFFCISVVLTSIAEQKGKQQIEKKIKALENTIEYLNARSIDTTEMQKRIRELQKDYTDYLSSVSQVGEIKDEAPNEKPRQEFAVKRQIIELKILNLEGEFSVKLSSMKRLDILYVLTTMFGGGFVIFITLYTIWRYFKRK